MARETPIVDAGPLPVCAECGRRLPARGRVVVSVPSVFHSMVLGHDVRRFHLRCYAVAEQRAATELRPGA